MSYKYDNYYVNKTFCKENRKLKRKNDEAFHILILNIMKKWVTKLVHKWIRNTVTHTCLNE